MNAKVLIQCWGELQILGLAATLNSYQRDLAYSLRFITFL